MTHRANCYPHVVDSWFAWRPVRLSELGNIRGETVAESRARGGRWAGQRTHWVLTRRRAFWRRVRRVRGLYLTGPVYTELPAGGAEGGA